MRPKQFVFPNNNSTERTLISLTETNKNYSDNSLFASGIFVDLPKKYLILLAIIFY